jgi:hypothetical protein
MTEVPREGNEIVELCEVRSFSSSVLIERGFTPIMPMRVSERFPQIKAWITSEPTTVSANPYGIDKNIR